MQGITFLDLSSSCSMAKGLKLIPRMSKTAAVRPFIQAPHLLSTTRSRRHWSCRKIDVQYGALVGTRGRKIITNH